jgi:deoxyadenosine/deoxycytidine kinase
MASFYTQKLRYCVTVPTTKSTLIIDQSRRSFVVPTLPKTPTQLHTSHASFMTLNRTNNAIRVELDEVAQTQTTPSVKRVEETLLTNSFKRVRAQPRILVCAFEGTIGIGKTTLLENIKTAFYSNADSRSTKELLIVVEEPVEMWNEPIRAGDETYPSILEQMYKGTCLPVAFQLMALTQRYGMFIRALETARKELNDNPTLSRVIVVTERSAIGDMMFAHINLKDPTDKHMYNNALKSIFASMINMHDISFRCFYLRLNIETVVSRIIERNRLVETDLVKDGKANDYLVALTQLHERQFNADVCDTPNTFQEWKDSMTCRFEQHTIDASGSKETVASNVLDLMNLHC